MKIAYIVPKLANKGPVNVVQELVKQMMLHHHVCVVYYLDEGNEVNFSCPTIRIRFGERIPFDSFDIVHTHGLRPDTYVFFHKPLRCKAKFVTTMHNYVIQDFSYQYNKWTAYTAGNLWMYALCRHDKIVTLSKDAERYYKKWFPSSKLTFAYHTRDIPANGLVADEEKQQVISFKGNSILIGVNAALTEVKGIDQVINVLPYLESYKLLIVGDGKSKESLQRLSQKMGVENRVLFMGYKKDAYRFLPLYDIYALPSRSEGFGLTLLEAAIYHKNVICSNIPLFREIVDDTQVAFFDLENSESLANAIIKATKLKSFGENLYKQYELKYSPDCFYNRYLNIYLSLIKKK